jgi:hypothetical protein
MSPGRCTVHTELRTRCARGAAVFALGLIVLALAGPLLDEVFCDAVHAWLGGHEFGAGGRASLAPAARAVAASAESGPSWTVALTLRVDGVHEAHSLRVNPRRMLWLPWLLALTLTAALAREPVRALREALAVSALVAGWALLGVWLTAVWVFASVPGLVYTLGPAAHAAVHALYEGLVGPPGARYVAGLVAAALVHAVAIFWERRAPRAASARRSALRT